jgi:hypothetical protein
MFQCVGTGCIAQGQCACSLAANRACNALTCSCPEYVKRDRAKLRIKRTFVTLLKLKWNRWGIMRIQISCVESVFLLGCHAQHGHLPTTRCSSLHQCRTAAAQGFLIRLETTRLDRFSQIQICTNHALNIVFIQSYWLPERGKQCRVISRSGFQMPLTTVTSCDIVGGGWYCAVDADSPGHRIENRRQHWERYSMPQLDCSAVGYGFAKPKQSSTSVEDRIVSLLKEDFKTEKYVFASR